mmetsp:Transcript_11632/g.35333  ORF Transcript_11632/g.35333 Transcript_11632/m.35333 type:complete len:270 (+) Transcript_11632:765-1574(+)
MPLLGGLLLPERGPRPRGRRERRDLRERYGERTRRRPPRGVVHRRRQGHDHGSLDHRRRLVRGREQHRHDGGVRFQLQPHRGGAARRHHGPLLLPGVGQRPRGGLRGRHLRHRGVVVADQRGAGAPRGPPLAERVRPRRVVLPLLRLGPRRRLRRLRAQQQRRGVPGEPHHRRRHRRHRRGDALQHLRALFSQGHPEAKDEEQGHRGAGRLHDRELADRDGDPSPRRAGAPRGPRSAGAAAQALPHQARPAAQAVEKPSCGGFPLAQEI